MGDGDPGTPERAVDAIEVQQRRRRLVPGRVTVGVQAPLSHPRVSETFAFERQERQLVGGIEHAQLLVELQTVDDRRPWVEADVFGTQITMTVDHAIGMYAPLEQESALLQEGELGSGQRFHLSSRKAIARAAQNAQIVTDAIRKELAVCGAGEGFGGRGRRFGISGVFGPRFRSFWVAMGIRVGFAEVVICSTLDAGVRILNSRCRCQTSEVWLQVSEF